MISLTKQQIVDIPFVCKHTWDDGEEETWEGKIDRVVDRGSYIEFHITSRSGFSVIVGPYLSGNIMVIETYEASLGLADPLDLFYNKNKALNCEHLNTVDGITAVFAFKALSDAGLYQQ